MQVYARWRMLAVKNQSHSQRSNKEPYANKRHVSKSDDLARIDAVLNEMRSRGPSLAAQPSAELLAKIEAKRAKNAARKARNE